MLCPRNQPFLGTEPFFIQKIQGGVKQMGKGNNADILLKFGVEGGAGFSTGSSGAEIRDKIKRIVEQLETQKITRIKFSVDEDKTRSNFKSQLQQICKDLNLSVAITPKSSNDKKSNGKGSGKSEEYQAATKALEDWKKAESKYIELDNKYQKNNIAALTQKEIAAQKQADYQRELQKLGKDELKKVQKLQIEEEKNLEILKSKLDLEKARRGKQKETSNSNNNKELDKIKKLRLQADTMAATRFPDDLRYDKDALDARVKLHALANEEIGKYNDERLAEYKERLIKGKQDYETFINKAVMKTTPLQSLFNTIGTHIRQITASALVGLATRGLSQVYTNVIALDKAVTNLQIATGKTRSEVRGMINDYAQLAKQLGATVTEVTDAADTWLRQGYDVAEANILIRDTMMLAKLGQLESAEAAKILTSAMKGYKLSVEEAQSVVDKFTAVDMEAAINAGDIGTAMAETAASAGVAGVEINNLIGYIATVGEVTQDGAESVGTFFKTLFARMGNIKAGKFVDDETGENLNDVEKVLSKFDISLRKADGTFRDFDEVLTETAAGL